MTRKEKIKEYCERRYPICIHWIDEKEEYGGGYYFAYLPDWGWSTVSATADTIEEALKQLEIAKCTMIDYYFNEGYEIPVVSKALCV